jgi:hypothetical protein
MYGTDAKNMHNFSRETLQKSSLEKPRCRWKNFIKMDVTEIRREGVDWSQLAKGREQK